MMMRSSKCNLELRLTPFADSDHQQVEEEEEELTSRNHGDHQHQQLQQQKLTIFYNGRVCVCDVIEPQAWAILSMAARHSGETMTTPTSQTSATPSTLSMKRSLQRFLQKRKNRIRSASPYVVNRS